MHSELPGIADAVLARLLPALKDALAAAAAPRQPILSAPPPVESTSTASIPVNPAASLPSTPAAARRESPLVNVPSAESLSVNAKTNVPTSTVPDNDIVPDTVNPTETDVPPALGLEPSAMNASPARDHGITQSSSRLPIGEGFTSLSTDAPVCVSFFFFFYFVC